MLNIIMKKILLFITLFIVLSIGVAPSVVSFAETERSVAEKFPKRCGLLFYLSSRPAWYDGRLGVTRLVSINQGDTRIPTWKIDCI